jgi:1-deoxy-D-xylulose-5-phosphate synthase
MAHLKDINDPASLRNLAVGELPLLAQELREFIIEAVATKEGHLGASLGVVELTLALHYVFNTPTDPLIWDVGHQAYGHKILTARREAFETNRQWKGISGFPAREESPYDAFGVGHSSTGVSAGLGMALAALEEGLTDVTALERNHIVVVGDAAIASGMAIEGLNHAGATKANLLVILNDNQMGIDPAVGALKQHFKQLSTSETFAATKPSSNFFTALGFAYTGVIDGHDLPTLLNTLKALKTQKGPRLLHIKTTKGKGLSVAEADQVTYHAPGKFNVQTGQRNPKTATGPAKYQEVFGQTMLELAGMFPEIMAITPAMPTGSSLKYMMDAYPSRALDVGIAEQHAVTLAAGMAAVGKLPYCAIYSTFLQRAYDQLIHDVALQQLPVVFCIDRAGLVGQDGATHHGVFDLAFLLPIPHISIAVPSDEGQLRNLLYTAAQQHAAHKAAGTLDKMGPIAIRYPRGAGALNEWKKPFVLLPFAKGVQHKKGTKIAVVCLGPLKHPAMTAISALENQTDTAQKAQGAFGLYDMIYAKPFDQVLVQEIFSQYSCVVTLEDGAIQGGFGQSLAAHFNSITQLETTSKNRQPHSPQKNLTAPKFVHLGIPDQFVSHGKPEVLYAQLGLDASGLTETFKKLLDA